MDIRRAVPLSVLVVKIEERGSEIRSQIRCDT